MNIVDRLTIQVASSRAISIVCSLQKLKVEEELYFHTNTKVHLKATHHDLFCSRRAGWYAVVAPQEAGDEGYAGYQEDLVRVCICVK